MRWRSPQIVGLALLVAISGATRADQPSQPLRLSLERVGTNLRVTLFNTGDREIAVINRFSVDELTFVIKDSDGVRFPVVAKISVPPPMQTDWCHLMPGNFVGVDFPDRLLKMEHSLKPGTYSVKAEYRISDPQGGFIGSIESSTVEATLKP